MALKFRRGTTAQQSGSLAFGEPYVNTTLGTLLIGGPNGDIILGSSGTGSTGTFGAISGSGLDITGNANIAGNLTLGGNITIGDAGTDTIAINADLSSSLIPNNDNAFTIGTDSLRYSNIYGVNIIGSISANNGVVSGSSQIAYASISSIPAGIVSGAAQVTPLLPTGTISGSSQLSGTSITDLTIINLTTVNQTASVVFSSGSNRFGDFGNDTHSFTGSVQISGSLTTIGASTATSFNGTINATNGVISGSSQILGGSGLVSGSSQVTLQSTTGFTAYDTALATITGSLISSASAAKTTNDSQGVSITNLNSATASLLIETANLESFTSSINTTIKSKLDADGVISGSAQINVASTTGDIALGTRTSGNYVASLVAGTNITLSNNTGEGATPTIGLTNNTISGIALGSNLATLTIGTGLSGTSYNGSTGVTIANTGVTSNVAGTGVTVSGATGAVTISIGQAVATTDNVRFASIGVGMAASGTSGRIDAANDIVAFSTSDIRFKENITPIENPIDKIRKISGNTYDWKAELKDVHGYEGNDVGVIAQEVEAVLPQLVQNRDNGYKAVKYDKLVALLIEGIKEQQLQIEQLRIDLNNCTNNKGL